jgi:hypothetical protein
VLSYSTGLKLTSLILAAGQIFVFQPHYHRICYATRLRPVFNQENQNTLSFNLSGIDVGFTRTGPMQLSGNILNIIS